MASGTVPPGPSSPGEACTAPRRSLHQEFRKALPVEDRHEPWRSLLGWFLTLNCVCIFWILFRATTFRTAWLLIERYCGIVRGGPQALPLWLLFFPPALLLGQALMRRTRVGERFTGTPLRLFAPIYGAIWAVAMALAPLGYRPFIYFQF